MQSYRIAGMLKKFCSLISATSKTPEKSGASAKSKRPVSRLQETILNTAGSIVAVSIKIAAQSFLKQ